MSCGTAVDSGDLQALGLFVPALPIEAPFQKARSYVRDLPHSLIPKPDVVEGSLPPILDSCRWGILIFDAPACSACDRQWSLVDRFLESHAGQAGSVIFFSVLPGSETRTPPGRNHAGVIVFDEGGHLAEQLGVLNRPAIAVIDEKANVRAWRSGLVDFDSAAFESLSVLIASENRPDRGLIVPNILFVFLIGIMVLLGYNLARRYLPMIYRRKFNN